MTTIGVALPTIPVRRQYLGRALDSVLAQTRFPDQISVSIDTTRSGAAANRNRATYALDTDWVAFLDDDDTLEPSHLDVLLKTAADTDADLVYPWFHIRGGTDPLAVRDADGNLVSPLGVVFVPQMREYILTEGNFIPVTFIVKRELFNDLKGFPQPQSDEWTHTECEDWGFLQKVCKTNARIVHHPERTWTWFHHGKNTSGRPDRW